MEKKTKLVDNMLKAIKIRSKITGISISEPILQDIERDLCDFDLSFTMFGEIGRGAFGKVFKVYIRDDSDDIFPMAMKKIELSKYETSVESRKEQDILKVLSNNFIENYISPHLPIYICSYSCDPDIKYNREATSFMIIMDLMDGGTLRNLLLNDQPTTYEIDVYMFQLFLLFYIINQYYPGFIHNDAHGRNIFFRKCVSEGYTFYDYGDDLKFYLPNLGLQIVLGDFGKSRFDYSFKESVYIVELMKVFGISTIIESGDFYHSKEKMIRPYKDIIRDDYFSKFRISQSDIRMRFSRKEFD